MFTLTVLLSFFTLCLADITLPKVVYDEFREIGDIGALRVNGRVDFVNDMNIKTSLVIETGGMAKGSCGIEINTNGAIYDLAETKACFADNDCTYFKIEASIEEINSFLKSHIEIRRQWDVVTCDVFYKLENHEEQKVVIKTHRTEKYIYVDGDVTYYKEKDLLEEGYLVLKPKIRLQQFEFADTVSVNVQLMNCGPLSNIIFDGDYNDFDEHEVASFPGTEGKYEVVQNIDVTNRDGKKNDLEETFLSKLTFIFKEETLGDFYYDCTFYYTATLYNGDDFAGSQGSGIRPMLSKEDPEIIIPVKIDLSSEKKVNSPALFAIGFIAVSSVIGTVLYFVSKDKEKEEENTETVRQTKNPMNEEVTVEV